MASAAETLKAYLHSARTPSEQALERNLTQQDDARMLDDLLQKAGESDGKRV